VPNPAWLAVVRNDARPPSLTCHHCFAAESYTARAGSHYRGGRSTHLSPRRANRAQYARWCGSPYSLGSLRSAAGPLPVFRTINRLGDPGNFAASPCADPFSTTAAIHLTPWRTMS
jgi:hypothetical protein